VAGEKKMKNQNYKWHGIGIRSLLLITVLFTGLIPATGFAQDPCEVPLFVKQNLNGANVMILADTSNSMNIATWHAGYDEDIVYSDNLVNFPAGSTYFTSDSTYYVTKARPGGFTATDFNATFKPSLSAMLVDSDNGEDGLYSGNYLNWIYYVATDAQRNSIPQVTRIQVLKASLSQVIFRSARLRFGLTVFQNEDGGSIIGKCGVKQTSLQAQIAGITANTWTPLAEATEDILDYFSYDGPNAAIEIECQYNFLIIVTDGLPSKDVDVSGYLHDADGDGNDPGSCTSIGSHYPDSYDCSEHLDDVAWWMANKDLRPDMEGDQNVITYVVGYHEDNDLLRETAENGKGLFFRAENAQQLSASIENAVQDILRRISAGSAVAVVSTERGTDDRLYRGKFMPVDWDGFLESYELPYTDGDAALWEAGSFLATRGWADRTIYSGIDGNMHRFSRGNASIFREKMGAIDDAEAANLIQWGLGSDVAGYRDRHGWKLGDIIHSTPVVVGPPSDYVIEESYQNFQTGAAAGRQKMVYVGANDGMLHAFNADDGTEEWAFVPQFALPNFSVMADSFYCHKYSVDQTVSVKDVLISGVWKTVLFSGGREGSSELFAMDITDPMSPDLLWQVALPNDKKYHSEIEIGSVGGVPIAIVGSGLDIDTGEAWVYAYKVSDGSLLGSRQLSASNKVRNKASRPALVDVNLDGQTDIVYMSDLLGSVWRMELKGNLNPSNWTTSELFAGTEELTADPVVAFGPNGAVYVYFGTGAYLEDPDMITLDQEYFICVFDNHSGTTVSMGDLTNQTSSINDVSGSEGWYVSLWNEDGERVTEQAVVVAETVIFTSYAPTQDSCVAGGFSYLYQMSYDNGGVPDVDGMSDPDDRSVDLGAGVASYPVVDLTEGTVVVQSSDASINIEPIASIYQRLVVRSWQESYDHVAPVTAPADPIVP
jgi:type IV pilus assembly protein PilY1